MGQNSGLSQQSGAEVRSKAPWAASETAQKKVEELDVAIDAIRAKGVSEEITGCLEAQKEKEARKAAKAAKAEDKRPLLKRIESTRGFLQRAEKRKASLEVQIKNLEAESKQLAADMEESRQRLKLLEAEAAEDFAGEGVSKSLEDAVHTLMVALHSCQLPPEVTNAAGTVVSMLPRPPVSEDVPDMEPPQVQSVDESGVPAGCLDVALPDTAVMEELGGIEDDSDAALAAWARRVKRIRHTPY